MKSEGGGPDALGLVPSKKRRRQESLLPPPLPCPSPPREGREKAPFYKPGRGSSPGSCCRHLILAFQGAGRTCLCSGGWVCAVLLQLLEWTGTPPVGQSDLRHPYLLCASVVFSELKAAQQGVYPRFPRARPMYSALRSAVYRLGDLGVLLPALTSVSPSAQQGGSRAGLAAAIPR